MIPVALYACCQLPLTTLIPGVKRADGTYEQLSSDLLQRCLAGREVLTAGYAWRVFMLFSVNPCDACSTRTACMRRFARVYQLLPHKLLQERSVLTTLVPKFLDRLHWQNPVICKECRQMLTARDRSLRKILYYYGSRCRR